MSAPEPEDWQVRLQAALALHQRRRRLREQARAELNTARAYGLQARHATKLRHARAGDTEQRRTK